MGALASEPGRLIDLGSAIRSPIRRGMYRVVEKPLEHLLSIPAVNQLFTESRNSQEPSYFSTGLRLLNVSYQLSPEDVAKIPLHGPLVVVANHPFGAVDGLILGDLLTRVRPDARLLGNRLLGRIPEMRPHIIPVNTFGDAAHENVASLRSAFKWLRQGGALAVFPAGVVSHLHVGQACVADPAWNRSVAWLIRNTGATAITVFFDGRNSNLFQVSGLIHPLLRTALLPSELLKRRNSRIAVRVGRPIEPTKIARYADDENLVQYLRFKTYMLKERDNPVRPRFSPAQPTVTPQPLPRGIPPRLLEWELGQLGPGAELARQGDYRVLLLTGEQAPRVLDEIGRLREETFRAVQEGTGRARDLDEFDRHYLQLVLWNQSKREIVGAYRIGRSDLILARAGVRGLYTSTLFKFAPGFLEKLGPALELGRSFVRTEYQGHATPLALLWRGIGEFLVRHPQYKTLFGPVSISRSYSELSRRLMLEFLTREHGSGPLAGRVKARRPPKDRLARAERALFAGLLRDVDDLSLLVAEIESDGKGVPILLRHYLRLNATLLGFNLDPEFGHCLDGLIMVDLRRSDPKLLKRFMGDEGYRKFCA
jgi:putative hemolysin